MIGHQKQWKFLKRSVEQGNTSHAYLFHGQEQLGKKTLASELAKLLNCKADFEQRPCEKCRACEEINEGRHPDLTMVEPDGGEIKIGQIRTLVDKLSRKPYSGPFKIAIIDQAHLLNQEAESALLKTVEEPKGKTVLILITSQKDALASTLVSRTQSIEFYPVTPSKIKEFLKEEVNSEQAERIARISLGRPGLAKQLTDPEVFEDYQEKLERLKQVIKGDFSERFEYAEQLSEEEDLNYLFGLWLNHFRRVLLEQITGGENEFGYSLDKIKQVLRKIQEVKRLIVNTNVNKRLALEILMMEL